MRPRQFASSRARAPNDSSNNTSMRSRARRASTGATPPLRDGMTSGERSTIAGTMKSTAGVVHHVAQQLAARPRLATRSFNVPSLVAATTSVASVELGLVEFRGPDRRQNPSLTPPRARWPGAPRATMSTRASASSSRRTLRSATSPPPTTSTRRPCRSATGESNARPAYPSSPCRPHSRFRPKKRVASASPASASERVWPVTDRDVTRGATAGDTAGRAGAGNRTPAGGPVADRVHTSSGRGGVRRAGCGGRDLDWSRRRLRTGCRRRAPAGRACIGSPLRTRCSVRYRRGPAPEPAVGAPRATRVTFAGWYTLRLRPRCSTSSSMKR